MRLLLGPLALAGALLLAPAAHRGPTWLLPFWNFDPADWVRCVPKGATWICRYRHR